MALRRKAQFGLTLTILLILAAQRALSVHAYAPSAIVPAYTQIEKGLLIDLYALMRNSPRPALTDLKTTGFTLVGTYTGSTKEWTTIANYVRQVHAAGMRAFVMMGPPQLAKYETALQWVKKAATIGADVIELDELVGNLHFTKQQLLSIIDTGLSSNHGLQFIVTEFEYGNHALSNAFAWTAVYPSVRVANDDYVTISYIDLEASLAQQCGKRPFTWLIFSKRSQDFSCYLNLDNWIAYTKQRNVDALFFYVDQKGVWQAQWPKVAVF